MEYKTLLLIYAIDIADAINNEVKKGWDFESMMPANGSTTCNFVVLMSRRIPNNKPLF